MPLVALSQTERSDLPHGTYDVRGWQVRTRVDGARVGEVHDLLIDERGVPRYLDVALGLFRKHVLIPIGHARADPAQHVVWVPGFNRAQFREIPAYAHDLAGLDRGYESDLVAAYSSAYARHEYRPRPSAAGAVYGPSELESPVRARPGRVAPLSRLGQLRVAPGEPDLRGWNVVLADGRTVGRVVELLVDTEALKVRSLECDVDEAALGLPRDDRRILIPVGHARLDEANRNVLVDVITTADLETLPVDGADVTSTGLRHEADRHANRDAARQGDRFYDDPRFDPGEFFGRPRP